MKIRTHIQKEVLPVAEHRKGAASKLGVPRLALPSAAGGCSIPFKRFHRTLIGIIGLFKKVSKG